MSGYIGPDPWREAQEVMVIENQTHRIHTVKVHSFQVFEFFNLSVADDATDKINRWKLSEQGEWIQEHAIESPQWHCTHDYSRDSDLFTITAKFRESDYVMYKLKFE